MHKSRKVMFGDYGDRAIAILHLLLDDDECSLDHHGYCQTHCWFSDEEPCPQKTGKDFITELRTKGLISE